MFVAFLLGQLFVWNLIQGQTSPESKCVKRPWPCDRLAQFRLMDGWCNNLKFPEKGASFQPFRRLLSPAYDDRFNSPRGRSVLGSPLASPRVVSTNIHSTVDNADSRYNHNLMQWGQFLDHDITLTPVSTDVEGEPLDCSACDSQETVSLNCFPIPIPNNDPYFPPTAEDGGPRCMHFARSQPGELRLGYREQLNQVTSFIDGSNVYGSDECVSGDLRLHNGGLMKMQNEDLLPPNRHDRECRAQRHPCFGAGDIRANEQPGLAVTHTVWVREHNRLARRLATLNPHWDDERLFQETRKVVIGEIQHITYNEFLPNVIGWNMMEKFELSVQQRGFWQGYHPLCDVSISNSFAAAAYRFGHTLVQPKLMMMNGRRTIAEVALERSFFDPTMFFQNKSAIDGVIQGLCSQPAQGFDPAISEPLRNMLFMERGKPYSGFDLASLNIQRGREHGVPGYTAFLRRFGLRVPRTFEDLLGAMAPATVAAMKQTYRAVDDVDLFTGCISERPLQGALVGPLTAYILSEQFRRLRHCDRFWYENGGQAGSFTPGQLTEIRKTSYSKVLCDNVGQIREIQSKAFQMPDYFLNRILDCKDLPSLDLSPWMSAESRTDLNRFRLLISRNIPARRPFSSRRRPRFIPKGTK